MQVRADLQYFRKHQLYFKMSASALIGSLMVSWAMDMCTLEKCVCCFVVTWIISKTISSQVLSIAARAKQFVLLKLNHSTVTYTFELFQRLQHSWFVYLTANLLAQCSKLNYLQDGYCDDITNIPECLYDGGDCCCKDFDFSYCSECHCISRNMTETCFDFVETTTTQEMTIPPCFVENRACGRIEDHYQPYDPLDNNIYESTIEGCQKQCQDKGLELTPFSFNSYHIYLV